MHRLLALLANLFPLWVLLALAVGLQAPGALTWFAPLIEPGLAVVMLGMGMTISDADFRAVLRSPRAVAVGFAAQYSIMPLLGWASATGLGLERDFAVGVMLVGCCPGGTASNVVTYLARANVPLSVLMTLASTAGAVVMTPLLTRLTAGAVVDVDTFGLLRSTALVVVLPLAAGFALNRYAPRLVALALPAAPLLSVLAVALICGCIVALNAERVRESGGRLVLALLLLHAGGFGLGYVFAWVAGYGERERRTVAIEVGMQNSGLGAVLAKAHFAPAAAVPCAVSAVMHSVLGSLLAGLWRLAPARAAEPATAPPPSGSGA